MRLRECRGMKAWGDGGGIQGKGDILLLHILVLEGKAGAQGDLRPHNATATIKVMFLLVHMHGTTDALGGASAAAKELCHHLPDCATTTDVGTVITV